MTHEEFLALRDQGRIVAGISQDYALALVKHLPSNEQSAILLWSWIYWLSIPGSIAVAIFVKWWVGLLLLFFVPSLIKKSLKASAVQAALKCLDKDARFFQTMQEFGFVVFQER